MDGERMNVEGANRLCVVCGKELDPHTASHCTPNSVVVILKEGSFRNRTRYFTCDGRALSEGEVSQLREKEAAGLKGARRESPASSQPAIVIDPKPTTDTKPAKICKKCGKPGDGGFYAFHHGVMIAETDARVGVTKSAVIKKDNRDVRQFYSNILQESYFLCGDCLKRWSWKKFWGAFIPGLCLTAISVYFFIDLNEDTSLIVQVMGFIVTVMAMAAIWTSFTYLLPKNKSKGEELAVEIGKKEINTSDSFWNSQEYEKLSS